MKIEAKTQFKKKPEHIIIPIVAGDALEAQLAAVAEWTDQSLEMLKADFKGDFREMMVLYNNGKKPVRFYLLGMGEAPTFSKWQKAFRHIGHTYKHRLHRFIGIQWQAVPHIQEDWIEAAMAGLKLSTYDAGAYKSEPKLSFAVTDPDGIWTNFIQEGQEEMFERAGHAGKAYSRTLREIFDLVNAPANKKTPKMLCDWAVQSGTTHGYKVRILDKKQCQKEGLHALLAVGQGSIAPPACIIAEYKPKKTTKKLPVIGLVGKGVTFDTGGLSIKPATNMHFMKSDMGGAAAVLGAMEYIARLQLPIHLVAIVPTTENCVDGDAIKPSDVIGSYSGKTIEVIDTDAEGRLILADGLAYIIKNFKPSVVVDMATLTGSAIRTFGNSCGALFSNNGDLSNLLQSIGDSTDERIWPLPMWEEYHDHMKSDVADIKNLSARPMAGAITAAKFLQFFTEDHPAWAHIDMAGMVLAESEYGGTRQATGYGVRLLSLFAQAWTNQYAS